MANLDQGSQKRGKFGIVREFYKPGKVMGQENFFMTCHIYRDLLIDELIFVRNV